MPNAGTAEVHHARVRRLIFVAITGIHIGQTVVFAILAPLGREVGLVEWQMGTIIACSSLVFSMASPRWGRLSDRWGRKPVMLTGLFGYTLGTAVFASVFWLGFQGILTGMALFAALVAARMAQSMVMSGTSPAAAAYLADITPPEKRTAAMGLISSAHSLGTIAGPAVAWCAVLSLLAPLYLVAFATLVTAFLVWRHLPTPAQPALTGPRPAGLGGGVSDRRVLPFIAVGVTMYGGFAIVQQTLGYFMQDRLLLSAVDTAQQTGYAMVATAVASLLAQWLGVRRLGWRPARLMRVGFVAMWLGFAGVGIADSLAMVSLCMGLVGLGMGLAGPGFAAAASLSVSAAEQGAVAGWISACPAMGFIAGPLVGALLYHWSPQWPSLAACVLFIPLTVFAFRSRRLSVH